ncbi:fasciclin-2 isoform X2 [Diachasmimorpha longicaudata]|uniref:fasciclin-2 isoform X2 n=1 Tax=Diachasmimorpha longicaudata TaxID=58733 RepID=UPI0030B87F80
MACLCGRPTAVAIIVLVNLALANGPFLEVLPPGDPQSRPTGSRLMLTCKQNGADPNLVTNLQWLDPYDRPVESRSSLQSKSGSTGPSLYTEPHPDASLSLVFNPLRDEQAGTYTCTANYANEPLNKSVQVDAIDALKWQDAPEHQYAILNEEALIKCKVTARPAPTVTWLKDDQPILTNDHYIVETHALKISNVQMEDQGAYTCQAAVVRSGEFDERKISVEVHEKPKIEEWQSQVEIIEGRTETIVCKARGIPPPRYSWVKSLTKENLTTVDRFRVDSEEGVLTINNVNREDAGEYQCIAENAAGTANVDIRVDVMSKPKIMEFLNRTMPVGKQVEITCKAFGRPPPEVTFKKQTSTKPFVKGLQPEEDRIQLQAMYDNQRGETVASLTIQNILRKDDGLYECIATNKVATAYKSGHLTVEFPPSFESMDNQTMWSWEQRPINLTCIAESIPNATIRWLLNDMEIERSDIGNGFRVIGNGPISTLTVSPSDTRFYGNYKCVASNIHGKRDKLIVLKEAGKPGIVLESRMASLTATTISFNVVLPPTEPELPLQTISVQYKAVDQNWPDAKNRTWSISSPYVLENLKPETRYEFRFRVRNQVGESNWGANLVQITPQRTIPSAPKMKMLKENANYDESLFAEQYEVQWIAPSDNGEPIQDYDVRHCEMIRIDDKFEVLDGTCRNEPVKGPRLNHWLRNLKPNTFYRADVKARNIIGYGEPGAVLFKTAAANPSKPEFYNHEISSAAVIGIVVAILFIIIVIIDVICCCAHKTGIIFYVCERSRRKPVDEEDAKLGSLYGWRFPLPYCDQKMANVAGVTAIQDSGSGKNTIKLVKHTSIEEKEPLKEEKKITPIIDSGLRRETSITFDGKRSVSKTGFVGKDSAV